MRKSRSKSTCAWREEFPQPPGPGTTIGIALGTRGNNPINGLRLQPQSGTNGRYLWCGNEMPMDDQAFSALHIEHIEEYLPQSAPYLALPPGYRFQIDTEGYEDVWFDPNLARVAQ